jgi:hypothetical protein
LIDRFPLIDLFFGLIFLKIKKLIKTKKDHSNRLSLQEKKLLKFIKGNGWLGGEFVCLDEGS